MTETDGVTDAGADDPAVALREMLMRAQGERLDALSGDARTSQDEAGAGAEPIVRSSPARRFWIALAASVVFVVVGVALFWNGASDRSMFTAAPSSLEGAFNQFSMMLAPGLVQAGTLGVVAVLVTWAITGRRSRREAE